MIMKELTSQPMAFSAGKEVDRVVSAQMLKKVLKELREITRVDFCLWDRKGSLVASTFSGDDLLGQEIDGFFLLPPTARSFGIFTFLRYITARYRNVFWLREAATRIWRAELLSVRFRT